MDETKLDKEKNKVSPQEQLPMLRQQLKMSHA
jgi:hypothetical protein